jgi:hypothetical protein
MTNIINGAVINNPTEGLKNIRKKFSKIDDKLKSGLNQLIKL